MEAKITFIKNQASKLNRKISNLDKIHIPLNSPIYSFQLSEV
jgi:hypothetical protein